MGCPGAALGKGAPALLSRLGGTAQRFLRGGMGNSSPGRSHNFAILATSRPAYTFRNKTKKGKLWASLFCLFGGTYGFFARPFLTASIKSSVLKGLVRKAATCEKRWNMVREGSSAESTTMGSLPSSASSEICVASE